MSEPALVPSAARAAASAIEAPLATADSTAVARSGVEPMLINATDLPWTATPTIAKSIARLLNFWNDQAAGLAGLGTWISVSSSPGSSAVSKMLLKNSAAGTDRSPPAPRTTQVDEPGRRGEPQLHQRQQRLAAGQELGVLAVLGRQPDGLVHGRGPDVGKRGRNHWTPSEAAARAAF